MCLLSRALAHAHTGREISAYRKLRCPQKIKLQKNANKTNMYVN